MGFAVETFRSAEETIAASFAAPDLAVIDVVLSGPMDGFALGAVLKQRAPGAQILYCSGSSIDILMTSGYIVDAAALRGQFISKPFTVDTFKAKVEKVLRDCASA